MAELADISNTVAEFLALARQQLAAGEGESAEQTARAVIALAPKSASGWQTLGEILSAEPGRRGEAAEAFAQALALDPKSEEAKGGQQALSERPTAAPTGPEKQAQLPHLGAMSGKDQLIADARTAEAAYRWKEARKCWEDVLALDPSDTWAWSQYGHLLSVHLHNYPEAEAAFRRAIEEDPTDDWAWGKLGIMIADFQGRVTEGQEHLKEAIRLDPKEPYYHGWLGWSLYRQSEDLPAAEAELAEAVRLQPDYQWAHFHLGYVRYVMGNKTKEARASFRRALELEPTDIAVLYNLGALYDEQLKQRGQAEKCFLKVLAIDPDHAASHFKLATIYERAAETYSKAQYHYQQILLCHPKDLTAMRCLAYLYYEKMGRFEEARLVFAGALEIAPDDADLHYRFGCMLWYDLEEHDQGIAHLKKATELAPEIELGWASLGEALAASKSDFEGAEACFLKALELEPDYYWVHAHYGAMLYTDLDRPDEAESFLEKAVEIAPDYGWGWYQLARFRCNQQGDLDGAHVAFEKAIGADGEDGAALFDLVEMNLRMRTRPDLVQRHAEQLCERFPESGFAWSLLGLVERYLNEDSAIAAGYFDQAVQAEPESHWCWHTRAEHMLYNCGEMGEAEEMLLRSMKYDTSCPSTSADLGMIRLAQGEHDIARALVEKALEEDDQSDECWRHYGRFLYLTDGDPALIEEAFDRAIEFGPERFENHLLLASFLKSQDDRQEEADEVWAEARENAPKGFDMERWANLLMWPLVLRQMLRT